MNYVYLAASFVLMVCSIAFIVRNNLKEWLLWAVTDAEKYLGSGTGKLKLRYVYDKFCVKFPALKYLLPFSIFSDWVDATLNLMREEIEKNPNIKAFVVGKE